MNQPLVTVITPVYNCEKYIAETVESVLDNGYENIEYIVIDDKSTDNTLEVLTGLEYGREDNRLLVIGWNENHGEHFTVNQGFDYVKKTGGKYFMIPNADDPLLPGAIGRLVNFMEAHPDILCAYPDWRVINPDRSIRTHVKVRDYDFAYMVRHHTCLPSVGSMFRSEVIDIVGRRDESFKWVSDFDYWLRIALDGEMARVPIELACWRKHDTQASGDKSDKRAQEHIRIMQKFYSMPNIPNNILAVKSEAICWSHIVAAAVTDSKLKVIKYLFKALRTYPTILFSFEFWDALVRRAYHILRR